MVFSLIFLAERECHSNLDCAGHYPCISHFPILHAMNRVMDDQFFVGMKKECFAAFDPTVGGKVLFLLKAQFDLISSPSPSIKIKIMGGKITEHLGFESPLRKIKNKIGRCAIIMIFHYVFKIIQYNKPIRI